MTFVRSYEFVKNAMQHPNRNKICKPSDKVGIFIIKIECINLVLVLYWTKLIIDKTYLAKELMKVLHALVSVLYYILKRA